MNIAAGDDERWAPVVGFRGYEVSSRGRVRSYLTSLGSQAPLRREPQMKSTRIDKQGMEWVDLASKYGRVQRKVSDLVASAFGAEVQS